MAENVDPAFVNSGKKDGIEIWRIEVSLYQLRHCYRLINLRIIQFYLRTCWYSLSPFCRNDLYVLLLVDYYLYLLLIP